MPKDLAALLVENGAVPADVVERAVARQQEAGGTLDTALLELGALPEDALAGWLARAAELPQAPATAWKASDPRARRVFPSRVAERHGLAPFALDGRELSLVATYPVDLGLLDEISFMLSLHLTAHVGPEWRVRELIHRIYGSPMAERLAALAAASGQAGAPPPAAPPEASPGAPVRVRAEVVPEVEPEPEPEERRAPPTAAALAGFGEGEGPMEPLAAALAEALENVDISDFEDEAPASGEVGAAEVAVEAPPEEEVASEEEPPAPVDRTAPPRWTLDDARGALAAARHRDELVVAALRYARDFFEYAAMFAVTRDAVAGHDALGIEEEARERARSVAIWANDPGVFKTVIETQSPYLGPVQPGAAGTDAVLHGLGRAPRTVLVYPIVLRSRPVCILYADNGEAPVSARRLGDLLLFLSTVGGAFERIIRDRKKRRRRATPPPGADVQQASPAAEPAPPEPALAPPPEAPAAPAAEPPPAPGALHLEPEPAPPAAPPAVAPAPIGPEEEGALSFAILEAQGEVEPAPSPERPESPPAPINPGRTAVFWPQAPAPAAQDERASDPWEAAQAAARAEPPAVEAAPAEPPPAEPAPRPRRVEPRDPPPVAAPPEPASLLALADRALDADPEIAGAACAALGNRRRDPAIRQAAEKLRRALLSGIAARATRAARAIGELRDLDAIPLLIQVLETSEPETAKAASDALAAVTLQRHGPDARRWLAWWKENRGRGRAEWLFTALTSPDRELRVAASLELSHAAPAPVAYTADMPAPDREKAARAWAGWWARSGNVL